MLKELLVSMRPKQWYKNFIVFVAIIFSFQIFNFSLWPSVIFAFVIFCMLSGSEYIINDIIDYKKDKEHPKKKLRPLTSGKLKKSHALIFVIFLILFAMFFAYLISDSFFVIALSYFVLTLIYSLFLKKFVLVDSVVISTGFVLRAVAGSAAIAVGISPWLIIGTFFLALFLAFTKRRHELVLLGEKAIEHRESLKTYSAEMLDQMIAITTAILIMSYSLYTFFTYNTYLVITIPFAAYCILRYLFLVHMRRFGGEAEMAFKDKGMLIGMALWALSTLVILYGFADSIIGAII